MRERGITALTEHLRALEADRIIIGLPLNLKGQEGIQAEKTRAFAAKLSEGTGLPVEFLDERFTSRQAEAVLIESGMRREKRRERVDSLSARLILQAYLDRR